MTKPVGDSKKIKEQLGDSFRDKTVARAARARQEGPKFFPLLGSVSASILSPAALSGNKKVPVVS